MREFTFPTRSHAATTQGEEMVTVSVSNIEITAVPALSGQVSLVFNPLPPRTVIQDVANSLRKLDEVLEIDTSTTVAAMHIKPINMLFDRYRLSAKVARIARAVVGGESVLLGPSRFAVKRGTHGGDLCFIVETDFRNSENDLLELIRADHRFSEAQYEAGGYNLHIHRGTSTYMADNSSEDGVLEVVKKLVQDFYCISDELFNIRKTEASSATHIHVEFNRCYGSDQQTLICEELEKIDGVYGTVSGSSRLFFKIANDFFDENETVGEVMAFLKGYDAGIPAP